MGEGCPVRKLIYVPILHTDVDLGSLAGTLTQQAKAVMGEGNWQRHQEVIRRYWQELASYWTRQEVAGVKIYQDAMAVDGNVGAKIVTDLAAQGSINYVLLTQLLDRGAVLMQTENAALLREEYLLTKNLAQKTSLWGRMWGLLRYTTRTKQLLRQRDRSIGQRINESLREAETGICFLGASHQMLPYLAQDISVIALKDPQKVQAYQTYIQRFRSKQAQQAIVELGAYLMAPIGNEVG